MTATIRRPLVATRGMRHAVLWVSEPTASAKFYEQALGLETKTISGDAIFMS
jgi:catechol-2,3-dioxygenase